MSKPACSCMVRSQHVFDPSGNLWDGDEDLTYELMRRGWTWKMVMVPKYDDKDHDFKCPVSKWVPPFINPEDYKPRRTHTGNGSYKGPWAFTLTMSPEWGLTTADMIKAAQQIMAQKSQPLKKFAWYLEYGKPDTFEHPHIHGMYETETGVRLEQRVWMRRWKKWNEKIPRGQGFQGGYHREVKADEAYSNYIKK